MKPIYHATREVEVLWQVLKRAIVSKRAFANQNSHSGGDDAGMCGGGIGYVFRYVCFLTTIAVKIKFNRISIKWLRPVRLITRRSKGERIWYAYSCKPDSPFKLYFQYQKSHFRLDNFPLFVYDNHIKLRKCRRNWYGTKMERGGYLTVYEWTGNGLDLRLDNTASDADISILYFSNHFHAAHSLGKSLL